MDKKETVLEAFLRQNNIDPNSYEQSEEYANELFKAEKEAEMKKFLQQTKGAFSDKPISEYMKIPSRIKSEDLSQKTEASPQMEGYDHSLEADRWKLIGGKDCEEGDDGIIMEEI